MARKKVREYDSKRILRAAAARVAGLELPIRVAQVRPGVEWAELATAHPWLLTERLVAKPDCLFGKRGKHDLVGLDLDFAGVRAFVEARAGRRVAVAGAAGAIDVFVVEPFVPHAEEFYMCLQVGGGGGWWEWGLGWFCAPVRVCVVRGLLSPDSARLFGSLLRYNTSQTRILTA